MRNYYQILSTIFVLALSLNSHSQWINEIHYDNNGTDLNECIEIAGVAGTDLTGYTLVLYNGSGGAAYNTLGLNATIPDEGCGFGAVSICYATNGIQNGPDGIALVDNTSTVLQFLSYEGSFTATDGAAMGMTSTDIGVSETTTTTVGNSLQLVGSGNTYGSFTWQGPSAAASQGTLNVGQTISPCTGNSITTGIVTGGPFVVDCSGPTTDAGSVAFTSTGTFNPGNIYSVELSNASGSFTSPITIGTLSSTANSGSINFTIPASIGSGTGYLIRIVSDDPVATGSASASLTITQIGTCIPPLPSSQGLLINEWSNGALGSQEYYEFVVAGQCGDLVDVRGYILDDNNGTFSTVFPSSSGIAQGHLRLTNDAQWANIPVGSLIVIYNWDDPNSNFAGGCCGGGGGSIVDDINDSNNDSLYVIPHNNASLFEITGTLPNNSVPDSTYSPVTYGSTSWNPLGLRNAGDAIQVRAPNGAYWHGVSYGGAEMTGGPNNMKISTSGMGGSCGWFTDGDYLSTANWTTGSVSGNETPGLANNALNLAWLRAMRDTLGTTCPVNILPVEIGYFIGEATNEGNVLNWNTITELNSAYFTIERSEDGKSWQEIGTVNAAGNSEQEIRYQFIDFSFTATMNYYRLTQTDFDGTEKRYFRVISIGGVLNDGKELMGIYNLMGQPVTLDYKGIQIHHYSDGTTLKTFND